MPLVNATGDVRSTSPSHLSATIIYLSPVGNDRWSGLRPIHDQASGNGPLQSLVAARDLARKIRRGNGRGKAIKIEVADGSYKLREPVVFDAEDSGEAGAPTVVEAEAGARPVFSDGESLTGWTPAEHGTWKLFLPEVAHGSWHFEQLWIDGRRCTRARSPNQGCFYLTSATTTDEDHCLPALVEWLYKRIYFRLNEADQLKLYEFRQMLTRMVDAGKKSFVAEPSAVAALKHVRGDALKDTIAVIYHSWEVSRLPLRSVDLGTGVVRLASSAQWDFCKWAPRQAFRLENYKEALDAPGEWFLSRDGWLFYMPRRGEDMLKAEVVAPRLERFLEIRGTAEAPVHDLRISGLTFAHAGYCAPKDGTSDSVSELSLPSTITADYADNIMLSHCQICHVGPSAVWLRRGCVHCSITDCRLTDLGGGGIRLGETDIRSTAQRTRQNEISDNRIDQAGLVFTGANGIWIGESSDNRISHNEIAHVAYSAISVGARWGYGESTARNNEISWNHIHDIGTGELNDLGGVYIVGRCDGSEIHDNWIHGIHSNDHYSRGAWAVYNDEGCSNVTTTRNLCYDTTSGGYCLNFGKDNHVVNNVFALGKTAQLEHARPDQNVPFVFERNIVYWQTGDPLFKKWTKTKPTMDHNLYWQTSKKPFAMAGLPFASWQKSGMDQDSLVADPLFASVALGEFRITGGSPALRIGFRPFDVSTAGPRSGAATSEKKQLVNRVADCQD